MVEELDIERPGELVSFLRETGRIGAEETPRVEVLAGGVSNLTVLVERANGEAWVVKQALEKLRVAVDWFSDPRRIEREALALQHLPAPAPPRPPPPLAFPHPRHPPPPRLRSPRQSPARHAGRPPAPRQLEIPPDGRPCRPRPRRAVRPN